MPGPRTAGKSSLGFRFTTHHGDTLACAGPVGGPFRYLCGSKGVSGALSLLREEGRSTFGGVVGILVKF